MTSDPLRHALLTARVPRYTSYPPADRFTAAVAAPQMAAWLGAVPPGAPVSLYVHVPFCRRLCWFCACRTQGTRSDAPLDRYLDHLACEVAAVADRLPPVAVSALHLGGGTPTLLAPDRLDRLAAMLSRAFPIGAATEVAVEIDPTESDDARLDALARMGLSRASIGVQDFDEAVQAAIGRRQSAEVTATAVHGLRARGVSSVNVDLLYGLPFQTADSLDRTVDTVIDLGADRIALYGYAHVPWVARRQVLIPERALPRPEARLDLSDRARARLLAAGYVAVGIDHFAKPDDPLARAAAQGRLRRNFQGYTTDAAQTLIALGPSAISRFPQGYVQNAPATDAWQAALSRGELPAVRGVALTPADRAAAAVIEALMCRGRVDLSAIDGAETASLLATARAALDRYPGAGWLEGTRLILATPAAARLVAQGFDPGAATARRRYSQAS